MKYLLLTGLLCGFLGAFGTSASPVVKQVLDNGLVVLVHPVDTMQKVSVQLWYNVGSKDEKTGERGLAHLLEHMVFKGTSKLSEADIPAVTHKLSGSCNAHTTADYTNYHFDLPVQHWYEALPMLADCMSNCTFKQDLLNAEFKVVIQELKMRKDNSTSSLFEKMFGALFPDHPYHYPVIGYKQDLWTVTSKNLHNFYKKHYLPNNAVLVVVGNVDAKDVLARVQKNFGSIKPDKNYRKEKFYNNQDLATQEITIYRDIKRPEIFLAYTIPGIKDRNNYALDVLLYVLGSGKSSRLNKKIVEERRLANWIQAVTVDQFEHDVLLFIFEPQRLEDTQTIADLIQEELRGIAQNGFTEQELRSAATQITSDFYSLMESNYNQAHFIGKYFLATGDEDYINHYNVDDVSLLNKEIKTFVLQHCTPFRMHKGAVLPFSEQAREQWQQMQQFSDAEDTKFLSERKRQSDVECGKYVNAVKPQTSSAAKIKKPDTFALANGVSVLMQQNAVVPKIELILELKASAAYDPADRQGLYHILCSMLYEGTEKYPGIALAQELDEHAISLSVEPGFIRMSMLCSKFEKGVELLAEVLNNASFDKKDLEKVKQREYSTYQRFLDSPLDIARQLAKEKVYGEHPYGYCALPDEKVINSVTRDELIHWYQTFISPGGARMAIVGDLTGYDVKGILEKYLGTWQGQEPEDLVYPEIGATDHEIVEYRMERDQIVLKYVGLSVSRMHPDFDALLLFDQILSGGLNSRLFNLRMRYGFFYRSHGSLTAGSGRQPGMVTLETIVSKDRMAEAESLLNSLIDTVVDSVKEEELEEAKQVVLNSVIDAYSTSGSIAGTLLFLGRYKFPYDYFVGLPARLKSVSLAQVKEAAKKVLRRDKMAVIKVGRVD
jgi:zinc protease